MSLSGGYNKSIFRQRPRRRRRHPKNHVSKLHPFDLRFGLIVSIPIPLAHAPTRRI